MPQQSHHTLYPRGPSLAQKPLSSIPASRRPRTAHPPKHRKGSLIYLLFIQLGTLRLSVLLIVPSVHLLAWTGRDGSIPSVHGSVLESVWTGRTAVDGMGGHHQPSCHPTTPKYNSSSNNVMRHSLLYLFTAVSPCSNPLLEQQYALEKISPKKSLQHTLESYASYDHDVGEWVVNGEHFKRKLLPRFF